jgi:hypothetical protein
MSGSGIQLVILSKNRMCEIGREANDRVKRGVVRLAVRCELIGKSQGY